MENNQVHDDPPDAIRKQVVYEQVDSSSARPAWPIIIVAAVLALALVVFIVVQIN